MTPEEILKKVIEKVVSTGFTWNGYDIPTYSAISVGKVDKANGENLIHIDNGGTLHHYGISLQTFIFSHDFAKAFWGDHSEKNNVGFDHAESKLVYLEQECWKHHLQQMVLEEDPIEYLRQFVL